MTKKKVFYLLALLLIVSVTLTGCSSGGDSLPGDDSTTDDDQTPTTETVSISGSFTFPEDTDGVEAASNSVNSLDNGDQYEIVVENFDTGNPLEDVDITFTEENKYKASGIKTGLNIVINVIRKNDEMEISTFIPKVTKKDEDNETVGNTDSATTVLTAIVKKQKDKSGSVEMNRKEVKERKKEIDEVVKDIKAKHLEGIVKDIEEEKVEPTDDITETITNVKKKIKDGQLSVNAENMVNFVRQSGILIKESANTHETIIKDNLDTLGSGMKDFTTEFESEMRPLFTPDFIIKLPTSFTGEEYDLSDLDGTEAEFTEELFEEEEWRWFINSGDDFIIISTNYPSMMDTGDNPEKVDLSDAEFKYQINDNESNNYFEGTFKIESEETKEFPVLDVDGEKLFDMTAPVDGVMIINGNYRASSMDMDTKARLNITLSEDTDLNDASGTGTQQVELDGYIDIPDLFEFDGQIAYDAEVEYNSDYIIQEINYIDVKADGLFTAQVPDQNNVIINAENIDFEITGPNGELQYIFLRGSISDEDKLVEWSGEIDVEFDTYTDLYDEKNLLVSKFDFKGSVNGKNSEELVLNINPVFNYAADGDLISGESTIRLEQGSRYLAGEIIADSDKNKVVLENENHSRFYFEENDDGIIAENSYIVNANGEKIADINADGRIYYMDDETGGRIGSLY